MDSPIPEWLWDLLGIGSAVVFALLLVIHIKDDEHDDPDIER